LSSSRAPRPLPMLLGLQPRSGNRTDVDSAE
jgi:hypothetical protein